MAAVDTIFEQLGKMSVLELVDLKKKIEDEWGITAAAPVAVAAPGVGAPAGDGAAAAEEKTSFDVVLTAAGGQKIQVIKVVRAASASAFATATGSPFASRNAIAVGPSSSASSASAPAASAARRVSVFLTTAKRAPCSRSLPRSSSICDIVNPR